MTARRPRGPYWTGRGCVPRREIVGGFAFLFSLGALGWLCAVILGGSR